MKVLLIGGGGREHALAWKLSQSEKVSELHCAPGNAGIAEVASCVPIAADDMVGLIALVQREQYGLVVVGPEVPLALGLADALGEMGVKVFGPSQMAAQLESSKAFTKDFCKRHNIPTADYGVFTELAKAKAYIADKSGPYVLKANGLAAGKGVVIVEDKNEAIKELEGFFDGKHGMAGQKVVIEDFMEGQEVSFFAVSDGKLAMPLLGAQDHKRAYDGDKGPNTGGMGAYSPAPIFTEELANEVLTKIIQPTVDGMASEGHPFVGVLFAGLMITKDGPKLIEYNARFGDPECQVLMRKLHSDLMDILLPAVDGKLAEAPLPAWFAEPVVNVVLAAKGYPGKYEKGSVISGITDANAVDDVIVFHAGTKAGDNHTTLANGGRVLNVTASGDTLEDAVELAYRVIDDIIDWPEGFCRRDIGHHGLT